LFIFFSRHTVLTGCFPEARGKGEIQPLQAARYYIILKNGNFNDSPARLPYLKGFSAVQEVINTFYFRSFPCRLNLYFNHIIIGFRFSRSNYSQGHR
jgi:hypothetical protein